MQGGATNPDFRGFLILARRVADDSRVGTFAASGTNYRSECDNVRIDL